MKSLLALNDKHIIYNLCLKFIQFAYKNVEMWSDASDQGKVHLILELSIVLVVILRCGMARQQPSTVERNEYDYS